MEADLETEHWYAVYTASHREKPVAAYLLQKGLQNYLPLYETVRQWSDRRVQLQMPLFPGYLFVHLALRDRLAVLQTPGVVRLVGAGGTPMPLVAAEIENLREGLAKVAAEPYPYTAVGQAVRVMQGPFQGMEGVLLRRKAAPRVVISLKLIERSFVVDIDSSLLAPIRRKPPDRKN